MIKRRLILFYAAALVLTLSGCVRERRLVIISTNDMHAQIEYFSGLATVVQQERAANPGHVLLVDAGDRWSGNPYVDRAPVKYGPIIDLMNELGYDVATFGNHEWDSGEDVLAARVTDSHFRSILANVDPESINIGSVSPYTIMRFDELRVALIGLIGLEGNNYPSGFEHNYGGARFHDPFTSADEYQWLSQTNDLYIAVSHMGYKPDMELARRNTGIDLIIGGHSHTVLEQGQEIGNTLITQTGNYLQYAGITTVTYRGRKVLSMENRLVRLDTVPADPRFSDMVARYHDDPSLSRRIGDLDSAFNKVALLNLFSDIMREEMEADFAFYNVGGMRLDSLPAGKVVRADIYRGEPFDNKPMVVLMTEKQVAEMIMNKFNAPNDKESHQLDLYPSGFTYRIITAPGGDATDIFLYHEGETGDDKVFRVAMSDYVFKRYKFEHLGVAAEPEGTVADHTFDYFSKNAPFSPDYVSRVYMGY